MKERDERFLGSVKELSNAKKTRRQTLSFFEMSYFAFFSVCDFREEMRVIELYVSLHSLSQCRAAISKMFT
jgi:hypothetical protein